MLSTRRLFSTIGLLALLLGPTAYARTQVARGGPAGAAAVHGRDAEKPVDDRVIVRSVFVPRPPERAFALFIESRELERWLTSEARVEPREGGAYELFWNAADHDNDSTIGCHITAIVPGQLLGFQWRSPRQFKAFANTADPLTHVVVTFIPEAGGTRIHLVHAGWRSSPEWESARVWQEQAWAMAFAELERVTRP